VLLNELCDFGRILAGDEARGEFGVGFGRNDGLGAFALIAAPNAIQLESGSNPEALNDGKPFFAAIFRGANGLLEVFGFPRKGVEGFAFGGWYFVDVIVEAGNGDAEIFVVELGKKFSEDGEGIGDCATINAGVKIAFWASQLDLVVVEAAKSVGNGRDAFAKHGSVGDDEGI
jgi:hypothetical protein